MDWKDKLFHLGSLKFDMKKIFIKILINKTVK